MDYNRKQLFLKSPSFNRFIFIVLLIFSVVLIMSVLSLYPKSRDAVKNRNQAREELENLKAKEIELKDKINSLNTNEGQEEALRSKYHVADQGEGVVVIIEDQNKEKPSEKGFFGNLRSSFFNE